jgi:hypothetical protein
MRSAGVVPLRSGGAAARAGGAAPVAIVAIAPRTAVGTARAVACIAPTLPYACLTPRWTQLRASSSPIGEIMATHA